MFPQAGGRATRARQNSGHDSQISDQVVVWSARLSVENGWGTPVTSAVYMESEKGEAMFIRVALMIVLALGTGTDAIAETPRYLWGEIAVPEGAVQTLAARAEAIGVATVVWSQGDLVVTGAASEAELLAGETYLYLDGNFFLFVVNRPRERAVLRGNAQWAEIIVWATDGLVPPSEVFLDLVQSLGLLPMGGMISLSVRELPLKVPRPPEGVRLDPTLWALVGHPDWFGAARDFGLDRQGLRVEVVAEASGVLAEALEPYVLSSTGRLMELLIPIPLLPELGRDPAVTLVRPPFAPHPVGGR
ncbi:TPA: hypothetical protein DCY67_05755 [Candidatus Acetothermia bacterium]|nr:hypothetical protein [Candidatus Acetothermia bacterium]